jgi:hypothetical protein
MDSISDETLRLIKSAKRSGTNAVKRTEEAEVKLLFRRKYPAPELREASRLFKAGISLLDEVIE